MIASFSRAFDRRLNVKMTERVQRQHCGQKNITKDLRRIPSLKCFED